MMKNEESTEDKTAETPGERVEKLPIDARLLSESVIELNISRRSVGLYPPGHAIITSAIDRSFELLQKLFELRTSITLGIAKDSLVIDEHVLDRRNPVYAECALSFHEKGIAGVTFYAGLQKEEIIKLHELLSMKDGPAGNDLIERMAKSGIAHIKMSTIEYSSFRFVEGATSSDAGGAIWEDYVYGLLSGRLTDEDALSAIHEIPPEELAGIINSADTSQIKEESYDKVITSYLRRKGESRLSRESVDKLFSLVNSLNPSIKKQFLSRTFENMSMDVAEVEGMLNQMTSESFEKIVGVFAKHSSMVPETLKNVIDKLSAIKSDTSFGFDMLYRDSAVVHDIEIGDDIMPLFDEDNFRSFVSEQYKTQLGKMMRTKHPARRVPTMEELRLETRDEAIDTVTSEVMLEVLDSDILSAEDCMNVLTRLAELATAFVNTGRFEEALNIHNALYSHSIAGRFSSEASNTLTFYFYSDSFISGLIDSVKLWGRGNRFSATRIIKALRSKAITPLMDALLAERNATQRRFLLSILSNLGSDVVTEAARRLKDERWYVIRNMLFLIRHCGSIKHAEYARRFVKSKDKRICIEALKTLLHFGTADSIPHLRLMLASRDREVKEQSIRLAGRYRVRESVPILLEALKKRRFLLYDTDIKLALIGALADIGSIAALEAFERIFNSRSVFMKGGLEEMKVHIFRKLHKFPQKSTKHLIELGRRSKNPEIREISERLMSGMDRKRRP